MNNYELNWSDIAFCSKKPLRDLKATFIAAPREMSVARFASLVKQYLPSGNIVIGISKEPYILGFENQPQFKTLQLSAIEKIIDKVNKSPSPHKITVFNYSQSDILSIYGKIKFRKVALVNGSWQYSFHTRPEYYALTSQNIPFEFVSPFVDEVEAKKYADDFEKQMKPIKTGAKLTDLQMIAAANQASLQSFDNAYQTGVSIGKKTGDKYELIMTSFNPVVPYQTFAWHFGASRERHMSPPGDLNHYDTVHAEIMMLLQAQKNGLKLDGLSLFINLLPCPTCARMVCETDINEIVYSVDHSDGYAVALLEKAGKSVRRLINTNELLGMEG